MRVEQARRIRWVGAVGAVLIVLTSCGGSPSDESSLQGYAASVEQGVEQLTQLQDEILATDEPDLEAVEELFRVSQAYLDRMAAIAPPEQMRAAHETWVQTAAEVQRAVGEVLDASDEDSFSFERLNARAREALLTHKETCRQLENVASEAGLALDPGCLAR